MGIDYSASYADVIEWDTVQSLVPKAAANFLTVIDQHKGDEDAAHVLAGLARCYRFSEEDPNELRSVLGSSNLAEENVAIETIKAAYKRLLAAFREATKIPRVGQRTKPPFSCLKLGISYHDSESQGCRGDEINGVYWYVDGAYELSPAGQKLHNKFERKFFTSWG